MTQTGVQILTGFLLTVPFSNRFDDLTAFQRDVYLAVLAGSVLTTGLVVAPVAMHRVLFRSAGASCSSSRATGSPWPGWRCSP